MDARTAAVAAVLCLVPVFALAGEAGDVESVSLTIYNNDLALIREVRPFDLDAGVQNLVLSEVSGKLKPQTVHLSLPSHISVELLEQNYDYDLVSRDKLLEKFIGREIILSDDERSISYKGTLLSVSGGLVLDRDGEILLDPPGRIILPADAADELLLKPTLSWMVYSPRAVKTSAEITYLSSGLSWSADYVVLLNADDTAGDIEAWVTLSNYSGTTYRDARLKLIAGDVHRAPEYEKMRSEAMYVGARGGSVADGFEEEAFFEYHLYDLQRPTTVKNNQQKQIGLLTANGVPMEKIFLFNGQHGGDVRVMVEFANDEESGMGMPLPAGVVRVFKEDSDGDAQFVGEDRIDHTPKDEDVRLYIGNAFDVVGEATQTEYTDIGKGYVNSYKVVLKNHKESDDVVVTVRIQVRGDWSISESSHPYEMKDAFTAEFTVPVKAGGEAELTYTYKLVWR